MSYFHRSLFAVKRWILAEDFEAVGNGLLGYDNSGWVETGGPNPNYTTLVLNGKQSWFADATTKYAIIDLRQDYNIICLHFLFRRSSSTGTDPIVSLLDINNNVAAYYAVGNGTGLLVSGTHNTIISTSADTTYSFWLEYIKQNALNGIVRGYLSTATTKPASPSGTLTNGDANFSVRKIKLSGIGGGTIIIDKLRISTLPIISNPV